MHADSSFDNAKDIGIATVENALSTVADCVFQSTQGLLAAVSAASGAKTRVLTTEFSGNGLDVGSSDSGTLYVDDLAGVSADPGSDVQLTSAIADVSRFPDVDDVRFAAVKQVCHRRAQPGSDNAVLAKGAGVLVACCPLLLD